MTGRRGRATATGALAVAVVVLLCSAAGGAAGAKLVLGSKQFEAPYGEGWGTAEPEHLFKGGGATGYIDEIHWRSWGGATAIGWGKTVLLKPGGGFYDRPGVVKLRAEDIGECGGRRAYRHLSVRRPSRPGGRLGRWRSWIPRAENLCHRD